MDIGFIGLGNMGAPMARNLARAGHDVTGFDLNADQLAALGDTVTAAKDPVAAVRGRDIVITMLPDGTALRQVAKDIIPHMKAGACLIDCSTVDIESAKAAAAMAGDAGLLWLDAPVSGGVGGATAGTLTFMVGGSADSFALGAPLFEIMGQRAIHCGASGAGQAAKICNNMILGVTMIATCEAFALADHLGLSRQSLFDVVSTSSGSSWSMNSYCPARGVGPQSPADNDYKPGFSAALMLKDLGLAQAAAQMTGTNTCAGKLAYDIYREFVDVDAGANRDFSAILTTLSDAD
jgi:3-hydroxyisobutyrate dehydrogenase